jgi:hypothetical protein
LYRNFIILQEDERGYSHSNDKALSGYAKVEAKGDKCKISFYAQNLRQEDNYSMVLICCKRDLKQLIDIGPLAINEVGKGDTSKEYYVNNIAGLGISYEKISGAAICKVNGNENEFVMHGFMNGEESADNWRKFKLVKVDAKKYINKPDVESKKKDIISSNVTNETIVSQFNDAETKSIKTPKLQNELVERNKDEGNLQVEGNIELKELNKSNSKVEDKQNRIPENNQNISKTINTLDEDRNKHKEDKMCDKHDKCEKCDEYDKFEKHDKHDKCEKCDEYDKFEKHDKYDKCEKCDEYGKFEKHDKHDKCEKCDEYDKFEKHDKHDKCEKCDEYDKFEKHDKYDKCKKCDEYDKIEKYNYYEKNEDMEEIINKLAKKLETYDGVIDLNISHHIHEEVIVYGFIKDKKGYDGKWKKFKLEKKCMSGSFNNIPISAKRIEENFRLDKLSEIDSPDKLDRLDVIDFDGYENDINKANINNISAKMGQETMWEPWPSTGMAQESTGTSTGTTQVSSGPAEQTESSTGMPETGTGTMGETGAIGQTGTSTSTTQAGTEGLWKIMPSAGAQTSSGPAEQTESSTEMPQTGTSTSTTQADTEGMYKIMPSAGAKASSGPAEQTESISGATPSQSFNIIGEVGKYFEKLARDFQPYSGNLNDINYCKWYKVNVNSIEDLSDESNYNKYTLAFYPMLNYYPYISKIGHFLLGYKCNMDGEMKYIVYAIPGSKEKNDQPYGGRTGFVTWTSDGKSGRGYWLMFYDFKNSSIVIPTK